MTRILVTGGSGYLGRHLVPLASQQFEVRQTYFHNKQSSVTSGLQLDIRDAHSVHRLVSTLRPDIIIHTAGSDRSPDMETVVCQGTTNLVEAAKQVHARIIHLSTDVLFDGQNAPYREDAVPSPVHAYGQAKATAEEIVGNYGNHVIVRTSLIYGLTIMDHSTIWITKSLAASQPVKLFDNQFRQPVWAVTLSQACLELAQSDFKGIINIAGRQEMNRAEFGLKMLDWWGVSDRSFLTVGPVDSKWPLDTRLDLTFANELLETPLLGVDEVLSANKGSGEQG